MAQQNKALDATFATIVGVCAFASSVIIGWICEVSLSLLHKYILSIFTLKGLKAFGPTRVRNLSDSCRWPQLPAHREHLLLQGIIWGERTGLQSEILRGSLCAQRQIQKRPWISLYLGAFGGLIGMFFFVLAIWAKPVAKHSDHSG